MAKYHNRTLICHLYTQGYIVTFTNKGEHVPEFTGTIEILPRITQFLNVTIEEKRKHGFGFTSIIFYEIYFVPSKSKDTYIVEKDNDFIITYANTIANITANTIFKDIDQLNKQIEDAQH